MLPGRGHGAGIEAATCEDAEGVKSFSLNLHTTTPPCPVPSRFTLSKSASMGGAELVNVSFCRINSS